MMGARKREVMRWQWADDIDFENRMVRLGTLKGGTGSMEYEWLAMNDDLFDLLKWQYEKRIKSSPHVFCHRDRAHGGDAGMAFVDRRNFVKRLCAKAEVPEFNYHDLRHTVARYLNHVQRVGMKSVQAVLRHKRQGTTEVYIGGNYRDTREAMKLLEIKNLKEST